MKDFHQTQSQTLQFTKWTNIMLFQELFNRPDFEPLYFFSWNPKPKSRGSKIKKKRIQRMFHNTRRKRKQKK